MKRIVILGLILLVFLVSAVWAQVPTPAIHGPGTINFVPVFTGPVTIGNSQIFQLSSNIGIGTTTPGQNFEEVRLEVHSSPETGGAGILGVGAHFGVAGLSFEVSGVHGHAAGEATGAGIDGLSSSPYAQAGLFSSSAGGNILEGRAGPVDPLPTVFRVDSTGKVFANGGFETGGADLAESFSVLGERGQYKPGDLLAIDSTGERRLALAQAPYSTLVAGIYSTKPGILASPYGMDNPNLAREVPLAVVGVVPCKVTTENGPINTGDLLVSSSTPGHAMKGTDRQQMLGAVVGKALEPLHEGTGVVHVLVTLQ